MTIDPSVLSAVISAATAVFVLLIGKLVSSRTERSQAWEGEGTAVKYLSDSAKTQINTYNEEILKPMRQRISDMEEVVDSNLTRIQDLEGKHNALQIEYDNLLREYESYKLEMTIQVSQLRKTINEKDIEIANLQSQIDKLIKGSKSSGKQMGER